MTTIPSYNDISTVLTKADAESQKTLVRAILAKNSDEFNKTWDDYISTLKKLGIEKAGKDFTKLLADKAKLWSGK